MKHAVIVGASRGLGFEMALHFARSGWMISLSGRSEAALASACSAINNDGLGAALGLVSDVSLPGQADRLWSFASARVPVDVWIQNAGINQPNETLDRIEDEAMDKVIAANLLGAMHGVAAAYRGMAAQGFGRIYTMEGFGSNGMMARGMTAYGASKAALSYFTESFARERRGGPVAVGTLSPGMMVTDFLMKPLAGMEPAERARLERVYNILADKPGDVAEFLVSRILRDRSKRPKIVWLTGIKAFARFALAPIRRRSVVERVRAGRRADRA